MELVEIVNTGKRCTSCGVGPALCLHADGRHLCPSCEAKPAEETLRINK